MQSFNDYEPAARQDGVLFGASEGLLDQSFLDLSYFPSYSPMGVPENVWGLGNANFEHQLFHPRTSEGQGQETMVNVVPYDERPLDTLSSTTWNKPRDLGQLTPLATSSTPLDSPGTITPTNNALLASPISPFSSSSSSSITTVSPEDGNTLLQDKRRKNRVAAAKCRKGAKETTNKLQQLERNLRQTNEILQIEAKDLRKEVYNLKTAILCHSHCDSESIQRYIQRAAERVGQEMG
ncbi:hypothetical protein GGR51DRAFT_430454 [Nemania sp. FL0031]|nr:hypothetical protein GGR51DRAFT_430454 [Nemania sp. FL0031]